MSANFKLSKSNTNINRLYRPYLKSPTQPKKESYTTYRNKLNHAFRILIKLHYTKIPYENVWYTRNSLVHCHITLKWILSFTQKARLLFLELFYVTFVPWWHRNPCKVLQTQSMKIHGSSFVTTFNHIFPHILTFCIEEYHFGFVTTVYVLHVNVLLSTLRSKVHTYGTRR